MLASQAAKIIGITHAQVCQACRKGLIPAKKVPLNNGDPNAYRYELEKKDVLYYKRHRPRPGPRRRT